MNRAVLMEDGAFDWTPFLGRKPSAFDPAIDQEFLCGKSVLITGAGGSIGSCLALRLATARVGRLVLLDIAEGGLFDLASTLAERGQSAARTESVVGDVCDATLLEEVFAKHRPDLVFHAAACKHVALMESNPFTAARNNIVGTHRLLKAAQQGRVAQVVVLSTDKAVEPAGIMGATKRVAELLVLADAGPMQAKAVRLANVLGSNGSVVPIFLRQIASGGPLTITDPACTRYFHSMDEAVQHLTSALAVPCSSTVLVPESGEPFSVLALAKFLIECAPHADDEREIVCTGLRPGEKLIERMTSSEDVLAPTNMPRLRKAITRELVSIAMLHTAIEEIETAVQLRRLDRLLDAIIALVPAYEPSRQIRQQVEREAKRVL